MLKGIIVLTFIAFFSSTGCTQTSNKTEAGYYNITAQELNSMLTEKKDFVLIDVHIPEQKHIQGTDEFIPYNQIQLNKEKLPPEDTKIVLYCRSGPMSYDAARQLLAMGYTRVYTLADGIRGWEKAGFKVNGPDRIIYLKSQQFKFLPEVIKVKLNDKVKIIATSTDVTHGFNLPEFNLDVKIEPGKRSVIEITADKKGEFEFYCSVYCGTGHEEMKGRLIIE